MGLLITEYKRTEKEEITITDRKKDNNLNENVFIRDMKFMIIENRQE